MTLIDKNNVIMPVDTLLIDNIKNNIDNIFENLIIHDNQIFNIYIFNHITFINTSVEFEQHIMETILKHIKLLLRNHIGFISTQLKKNKYKLTILNNFLDIFIKLILRINSMLLHVKINSIPNQDNNKWGNYLLMYRSITLLHDIIFANVVVTLLLNKSISENMENQLNREMYIFFKITNNLSSYNKEINFTNIIDNALLNLMPCIDYNIASNIEDIYRFKSLFNYYELNCNKYKYINTNQNIDVINGLKQTHMRENVKYINFTELLETQLDNIIKNNNITFLAHFIEEHHTLLLHLDKYIDIIWYFLLKSINTLDEICTYYNNLYNLAILLNKNKTIDTDSLLIKCISLKINTLQSSESIIQLVNIIDKSIISKKVDNFLYIVGSKFKNRDEFLKQLSSKLMFRGIYCYNSDIEKINYIELQRIFTLKELYQYTHIFNNIEQDTSHLSPLNICQNSKIFIISLDCWNINHSMSNVTNNITIYGQFTQILEHIISRFQYGNKSLIIYPHLGMLDITFTINEINKSCDIILSPLQMMCLELFQYNLLFEFDIIHCMLKVNIGNSDLVTNIIKSLIRGGILVQKIVQNITLLGLNSDLPEHVNLIHYLNNSIDIDTTDLIQQELAHERIDILGCNINSIIKTIKMMPYIEVYDKCKTLITQFIVTKELFDNSIEMMCKKEYIDRDSYNTLQIIKKIDW